MIHCSASLGSLHDDRADDDQAAGHDLPRTEFASDQATFSDPHAHKTTEPSNNRSAA